MNGYKGLQPKRDAILVRRHEQERTAGGIIIPESAKENPYFATVLAVGDGATTPKGVKVPNSVKAGDVVLYGKLCGRDVEYKGEELFFIKDSDVWAVVE
jgi:chaperonin GroES